MTKNDEYLVGAYSIQTLYKEKKKFKRFRSTVEGLEQTPWSCVMLMMT